MYASLGENVETITAQHELEDDLLYQHQAHAHMLSLNVRQQHTNHFTIDYIDVT